jgi:hypothetical protein
MAANKTPEFDVLLVGAGFGSFSVMHKYVFVFVALTPRLTITDCESKG